MNEAAKIINPSLSRIGFFSFFWVSSLKIKFIVLLIVFTGLCVLVSSATAILFILHIQEPKVQAEIPKVKALPTDLVYEIRNLSFSVSDKMLIRNAYVQFVLSIQCRSEECLRQLELNRAKLIDLVYEVSSPFFIENFNTPRGMQDFKKLLFKAYVERFGKNAPEEINFKDWVMN